MKKESLKKLTNLTLVTILAIVPTLSPIAVYATPNDEMKFIDSDQIELSEPIELKVETAEENLQENGLQIEVADVISSQIELKSDETVTRTVSGFNLVDWTYSEDANYITLEEYKGESTVLIIPGQYNGKQVRIMSIEDVFPQDLLDLKFEVVNEQKVLYDAENISKQFYKLKNLITLDLSGLDTSKVTDMSYMFAAPYYSDRMKSLNRLNLSGLDTSNVINMEGMFYALENVAELDLSSFDTSNVRDMYAMFANTISLKTLDLSSFDTSDVTRMNYMFRTTTSLTSLDLSSFDTSNVTSMDYMFEGATSLTFLDLSSFNTSSVLDMKSMFAETKNLKVIDMSNFKSASELNVDSLFALKQENFVPLLIITDDEVLKEYDFKADNRTGVKMTLNANGGRFPDQSFHYNTSEFYTIKSNEDKYIKNLITQIQSETWKPTHSKYPSFKWSLMGEISENRLEKIYDQLTGEYDAVWLKNIDLFTYNTPSISTTTISGKGISGAKVGVYDKNGKRLAITTVNSKGNYKLTIPKQKVGTKLVLKQAKSGYLTASKNLTVLNELRNFAIKTTPTTSTTAIYGTGVAGAKVGVYNASGKRLAITTVNSKGNYKLVMPKQKAGTILTVKQAKSGYLTASKTITVVNEFKTFSVTTKVNSKTTAIYGKGVAGAKVGIYDKNGKRLAITTVNSKGNYKLVIPKQKVGTKLTFKQAKSGYLTASKTITVVK